VLIGIDFDNTIACYDENFLALARDMGLVPAAFRGGKKAVRDAVRAGPGGDVAWQQLQARAYGRDIGRARLTDGIATLLERARLRNIPVAVVSHKTQFSPFDPETDLRNAAMIWMESNGLFERGMGVARENVFFEPTRQDKIRRIAALGCTHFIDDLDEVFGEPGFPGQIRSYLYAAGYDELPRGRFRAFRTHREIADHLLGVDPAEAAAGMLKGASVTDVVPVRQGGNNRLYRVTGTAGIVALKSYPSPDDDPRDRLGTEFGALSFLKAQGEESVPSPVAISREMNAALYQWIEGTLIEKPDAADIHAALDFLRRLHDYRSAPGAAGLPLASEACLSTAEILRQIAARETRLAEIGAREPLLGEFLARLRGWRAALTAGDSRAEELPMGQRTLSPSDFGFHNALRTAEGHIVFVDFEYFGWDDPVKLTADFLLHPGMALDPDARRRFARGMVELHAGDVDFRARLEKQLPLYALRWCLILLNEFLPERWARRAVAGEGDHAGARARQLAKAEAMLARTASAIEDLP